MGLQAFYFDLAFQLGHYVIAIVKISVVIAVVNFSLNYWLIPTMGINGAAIATLSSFAIGSILSAIMGRRHFTLPFPMKEFTKIVLASLVMGFCLWWLKEYRGWGWLALQLGVGIISYVIMILAFNVLDIRAKIKERISA
jgi:O-antigen/teichoic acid export membrane protein